MSGVTGKSRAVGGAGAGLVYGFVCLGGGREAAESERVVRKRPLIGTGRNNRDNRDKKTTKSDGATQETVVDQVESQERAPVDRTDLPLEWRTDGVKARAVVAATGL